MTSHKAERRSKAGFPTLRKILTNAGLFLASCLVAIAMMEGVSRIVFKPGEYLHLGPRLISDPILDHRLPPGLNGHDANGLRNRKVPETVDILAVGDSLTYGFMAVSAESWPAHLARITGKSVYNAGLGGYGPLQYLHLVQTLAPELKPKRIVVMVTTNDPGGAYQMAHKREFWKGYRNSARDRSLLWEQKKEHSRTLKDSLRLWLRKNSMLRELGGIAYHKIKVRTGFFRLPDDGTLVEHLGNVFVMRTYGERGDGGAVIEDPKIVEGMAITKRALGEIAAFCEAEDIELHVALMPSHTQIFYPFVRDQLTDLQAEEIKRGLQRLENISSELIDYLSAQGLPYTDLTAPMIAAFERRIIYPVSFNDQHPNGDGYRVVAEALADALQNGN